MHVMNTKNQRHLRHAFPVLPESVPDSVLKADEIVLILCHEVACVEISISFLKNIPHDLFLR